MNKQDLIQKLKQLDGLTSDEKAALIDLVKTKKKYGLVWEDKPEAVEEQLRQFLPVLKEVKEKRILAKDVEPTKNITNELFVKDEKALNTQAPNHILIEGDNLHALTALTFTHQRQIDLIYIDPPYNTGSNDFRYNDNYVDKDDVFRHSKWLSFINKRLRIAKSLLKTSGVIFISINEDELCQLKILTDEIFGLDNYLTVFTIKVRHENRILKGDKDFHEVTEFLLMYRNSSDFKTVKRIEDNTSNDLYTYRIEELVSNPELITLDNKLVSVFRSGDYRVVKTVPNINSLKKISIRGSIKEGNSSGRFFMKHFADKIGKEFGTLYRVPDMGDDEMPFRYFLLPDDNRRINGDYFQGVPQNRSDKKDVPYPNYFDFVDEFNNVGYEGDIEFRNGKKPINFLQKIYEIAGFKNGILLDFFAGSGSTLHAAMQLNFEDGGKRQCILVTNNENNICEEVTYERNKKVIEGYYNIKGLRIEGLTQNNLRYYKSEFVSSTQTEVNKRLLTQASSELLQMKEDCYTDITKSNGFNPIQCGIFTNEVGKYMIVVYHSRSQNAVCEQLIGYIKTLSTDQRIKLYAFSPEKETLAADFAEVADKIVALPLPDAIYNAYRATFRTLKLDRKLINPTEAIDTDNSLELFDTPTEE